MSERCARSRLVATLFSSVFPSFILVVLLLGFVIAPTPGDIGGCGQSAQLLDANVFYRSKAYIDCDQCLRCDMMERKVCREACDDNAVRPEAFAPGCYPLVHDGEVCLRALSNASCSDYGEYMHQLAERRSTPSECNFCPVR